MNGQGRNSDKDKRRFVTPNIDTMITDIRFRKDYDGRAYREIDATGMDNEEGIINRVTREILLDACDEPITSKHEVAGTCKRCGRMVKKENAVKCKGRCGQLLCRGCYQKQGDHVWHDKRYCRWDYWMTKLFWQHVSPALKNQKNQRGARDYERKDYRKPSHPFIQDGRQIRFAQKENR